MPRPLPTKGRAAPTLPDRSGTAGHLVSLRGLSSLFSVRDSPSLPTHESWCPSPQTGAARPRSWPGPAAVPMTGCWGLSVVDQGQGQVPPIWGPCPHRAQPGPLYGGQWLPEPGSSADRKAIKSLHAATAHVAFEGPAALEPVPWPLTFASPAGAQGSPGSSQPSRHVGREPACHT